MVLKTGDFVMASIFELRGASTVVLVGGDLEPELLADMAHGIVLGEDLAHDAVEFFRVPDFDELFQQFKAKAQVLPGVVDEDREFRLVGTVLFAQPADTEYFPVFVLIERLGFGHQRDFTVIIVETDARQAFMCDALFQVQRLEVAVVNALLGQRLMEFDHQRLILGPDRADGHRCLVLQFPRSDILHWIRTDGRAREFVFRRLQIVQYDAGIEREDAFGGDEQGIDVDLGDPRLLDDELAEADHQLFESGDVHGLASTYALQRPENFCALHHAPGKRAVQRGQSQRAVLVYFDKLAAGSKQQHRAELRINAAADDEFVTFKLDHRLHGDAEEVLPVS